MPPGWPCLPSQRDTWVSQSSQSGPERAPRHQGCPMDVTGLLKGVVSQRVGATPGAQRGRHPALALGGQSRMRAFATQDQALNLISFPPLLNKDKRIPRKAHGCHVSAYADFYMPAFLYMPEHLQDAQRRAGLAPSRYLI